MDSTKAAIIAAYRAAWADIDAVQGHYPINLLDPRLADHMAGDALNQVRSYSLELRYKNEYLPGPPIDTSGAIVKQFVGTAAVVADCNIDGSILMNGQTNKVIKAASTDRTLANAKMELIDGSWKMTQFSNESVLCTTAN